MADYETLFITAPTLSEEETDEVAAQLEILVRERGAKLRVEKWGKKRMAFEVRHHKDGYFYLFEMDTAADVINELERRMKLEDKVIRYLTVRTDEEKRRARKRSEKDGTPPPWERKESREGDSGEEEE
jgi:small subunit ribosomal protein S6